MSKYRFVDKFWRTVVGLIIIHPIFIWRAGKVFIMELQAEYSVALKDLREMWNK